MNGTYKLTYEAWPFSAPVEKQKEYDDAIGERQQTIEFRSCSDFDAAYRRTKDFLIGVQRNTRVWQTVIVRLEYVGN